MFHERKWWVRRIWQECRSDGHWDPSIGPLPAACLLHLATICQDHIYLLGYGGSIEPSSMLVCSLADLLQSCRSQSGARLNVWHKLSSLRKLCHPLWTAVRSRWVWQHLQKPHCHHPPVQPSNQLLGGHQPHAPCTVLHSSSSPPWQQTDGGGRLRR